LGIWGELARRWFTQTQAVTFGSPAVFRPNPASIAAYAWPAPVGSIGLYDLSPLQESLEELVDFELLNRGDVRLTVVAVDIESGDRALFDTQRERIGPRHIVASGAMLVEFPPVEIDGRLLGDGGLRSNLPIDVVARQASEDMLCFAVDVFSAEGHRFRNLPEAATRRQELLLVSNGLQFLEAHRREQALRRSLKAVLDLVPEDRRDRPEVRTAAEEVDRPEITLARLAWSSGEEIGVNTYDWSDRTLTMRWRAGELAASKTLRALAPSQAQLAAE
jgi:NTE family protein